MPSARVATFPVRSSVLSEAALAAWLAEHYGLPAPRCRLAWLGLNDTYRVDADDETFYLRVYRHGWRSHEEVAAELALLDDAHAGGLPVSVPRVRRDGARLGELEAPEGRRFAALFAAAIGEDAREVSTVQAHAYGRFAAQLHDLADRHGPVYTRFHLDEQHLLDDPLAVIRAAMGECCPDEVRMLEEAAERVRAVLARLPRDVPDYGLCHGDLHLGNVRFRADNEPVVFDFDCCGYGWRIYDVAVFIWNGYLERRPRAWRERRQAAFLRGYRAVRPLPEEQMQVLPAFLTARQIWLLGLDCQGRSDWLPQWMTKNWLREMIAYIDVWEPTK